VPLIFHLTGGRLTTAAHQVAQQGSASFQAKDPISSVVYVSAAMTENVSWMINTGALERYPDLQVVMTEGYAGWLGWLVGFMDEKYLGRYSRREGMAGRLFGPDDLRTKISAPPSYYLKRQVKATFMYDPAAIQLRNLTGVEALMWGNDYPHIEGVFPDSQAVVEKQFEGVPEDEILAMVHDNAAKLYGLTV
jgi:predicted TIM-barrel fold metal-dependent hydrolase